MLHQHSCLITNCLSWLVLFKKVAIQNIHHDQTHLSGLWRSPSQRTHRDHAKLYTDRSSESNLTLEPGNRSLIKTRISTAAVIFGIYIDHIFLKIFFHVCRWNASFYFGRYKVLQIKGFKGKSKFIQVKLRKAWKGWFRVPTVTCQKKRARERLWKRWRHPHYSLLTLYSSIIKQYVSIYHTLTVHSFKATEKSLDLFIYF